MCGRRGRAGQSRLYQPLADALECVCLSGACGRRACAGWSAGPAVACALRTVYVHVTPPDAPEASASLAARAARVRAVLVCRARGLTRGHRCSGGSVCRWPCVGHAAAGCVSFALRPILPKKHTGPQNIKKSCNYAQNSIEKAGIDQASLTLSLSPTPAPRAQPLHLSPLHK